MGDGTECEGELYSDDEYFYQFHKFDRFKPLSGDVPERPFALLPSIAARARRLLHGRSHSQIVNVAASIEWMISDHRAAIQAGERHFSDYKPIKEMDKSPNDIEILKDGINWYVLTDDEDFPEGKDFEYFAVLALLNLADALEWLAGGKGGTIASGKDFYSMSNAGECALMAMDAISHSEQFATINYYFNKLRTTEKALQNATVHHHILIDHVDKIAAEKAQEKISIRASKNAIKGHAERNRARDFVRHEWELHKDAYDRNKSGFVRSYVGIVANKFKDAKGGPLKITEKQMREVWLAESQPVSK